MRGYDARLEILPHRGILDLRGDAETRRLCGVTLGCDFPRAANSRIVLHDDSVLICISPDHWIFETTDGNQDKVLQQIEQAASRQFHSFVDVSDMYSHISLSGPEAREVLSQGIAIDIHPLVFGPGSTARCAFADTTAQLTCTDSSPTFEISVFSSYERYAVDWLSWAAGF